MSRSELKAKLLADLDIYAEVVIEAKYIPLIWGDEDALDSWCESWKLRYGFYQEVEVARTVHGVRTPVQWLEITRIDTPISLILESQHSEERITINETDACL